MQRAAASVALFLALASSSLWAQTQPQPSAKPAKVAAKAPKKVEATLPPAEGEQLAAAAMTHFGGYECEFKQTVKVAMNPKFDGYVDVSFGKQVYTMKPTLSSTGALRLEDVKGQTLMLQIAYKSMLMDVKAGRRIVDECVHEKQLEAKQSAADQPQASLLTGDTGTTSSSVTR